MPSPGLKVTKVVKVAKDFNDLKNFCTRVSQTGDGMRLISECLRYKI